MGSGGVASWADAMLAALVPLLLAAAVQPAGALPTLTADVGLLLPLTGPACVQGTQYWNAVLTAKSVLETQQWWPRNLSLNVDVLPADAAFVAWQSSAAYVVQPRPPSQGIVGFIGPTISEGVEHVKYEATESGATVVGFSTSTASLTLSTSSANEAHTLLRMCESDLSTASATYALLRHFGWQMINVMYSRNPFGRTFMETLSVLVEEGERLSVVDQVSFQPKDDADIELALRTLRGSSARVVVLASATVDDARRVMLRAHRHGMTGKGWTWIGGPWVHAQMWMEAEPASDSAAVLDALQGVVGVRPDDGLLSRYMGGSMERFRYVPNVTKSGNATLCPALLDADVTSATGIPADPYVAYAFDAMWTLGATAAKVYLDCSRTNASFGIDCVSPTQVFEHIKFGVLTSPITGEIRFMSSGDRESMTLEVVNVQKGGVVEVAKWLSSPMKSNESAAEALLSGSLTRFTRDIVWPGNEVDVPSDRVHTALTLQYLFFFIAVAGVGASVLFGNILHRHHIHFLPESGATIIVGVFLGFIIRMSSSGDLRSEALFDAEVFKTVFLPIIIFESGFAMQKHPFFTQLGSILMFALLGTLISTLVTGMLVLHLGRLGAFTQFSLEEAMSFASLISATDPVATLSVFQALNVDHKLYAIVYGESVLNDAVAIVLYATFTRFITTKATPERWAWAGVNFFVILGGSTLVGFVFGVAATLLFKYVRIAHADSTGIEESAVVLIMAYASFVAAESIELSGIVSSLFCGITMNHYTLRSMSPAGKQLSASVCKSFTIIAETTVFVLVGVNIVLYEGVFEPAFVLLTIVIVLIARACNVFPISFVLNRFRSEPILKTYQVQIWHAGLRGAIAYALSIDFPTHHQAWITNATSCVIMFSIFLIGGTTAKALDVLKVKRESPVSTEVQRLETHDAEAESAWKHLLAVFDRRVMRPFLFRAKVRTGIPLSPEQEMVSLTRHVDGVAHSTTPVLSGSGDGDGDGPMHTPLGDGVPNPFDFTEARAHAGSAPVARASPRVRDMAKNRTESFDGFTPLL